MGYSKSFSSNSINVKKKKIKRKKKKKQDSGTELRGVKCTQPSVNCTECWSKIRNVGLPPEGKQHSNIWRERIHIQSLQ